MDAEAPSAAEVLDVAGQLPSSSVLGGGSATALGTEDERLELGAVTTGLKPRAVSADSEAVALESTSVGSESEGSQAHRRDWGLFVASEFAELSPIEEESEVDPRMRDLRPPMQRNPPVSATELRHHEHGAHGQFFDGSVGMANCGQPRQRACISEPRNECTSGAAAGGNLGVHDDFPRRKEVHDTQQRRWIW
ncbi:hypothetical protein GUJ93_ZPchr0005g15746 [Zizania palustris]|uniref:Uncharacterized protein n=1 Tax=Zizania palustris TaxID=103762 RepID=A0A8J5SBX6_ZIZPA|nr:hypothetical protein GUJ93_ZPchr0005g15746 [Zizania palustris]